MPLIRRIAQLMASGSVAYSRALLHERVGAGLLPSAPFAFIVLDSLAVTIRVNIASILASICTPLLFSLSLTLPTSIHLNPLLPRQLRRRYLPLLARLNVHRL